MKSHWNELELTTPHLMDAQRNFGYVEGIAPIGEYEGLVMGPARTVWCQPGENQGVRDAIAAAQPGEVLVVAGNGSAAIAMMGENVYDLAVARGIVGIVIDGPIRDSPAIARGPVPLACKGVDPRRPRKSAPHLLDVPVAVGGVPILPGDLVALDAEGVVRIPSSEAEAAVASAHAAAVAEAKERSAGNVAEAYRHAD